MADDVLKSVCVFCGSRMGNNPAYAEVAASMGRLLAGQARTVVYGGGHVGLMGALADGALAAGGTVIGVIPKSLQERELGHSGVTELHVVETMHDRKALMAEQSEAFIALPGGLGTYEEIFETATWSLLGIHNKPLGFLNVNGFYDLMEQQLDLATQEGFLLPEERELVLFDDDAERLLQRLDNFERTTAPKWMSLHET